MPRTSETASFKFNHTMIRIKDPKVSLPFYMNTLGMDLLLDVGKLSSEDKARATFNREGVLELTHNHGTESDPGFHGYASGNAEPGRGFGHISITVDNIEEACARFERLGAPFQKRLTDGRTRNMAMLLDPDGYWVAIVPSTLVL